MFEGKVLILYLILYLVLYQSIRTMRTYAIGAIIWILIGHIHKLFPAAP